MSFIRFSLASATNISRANVNNTLIKGLALLQLLAQSTRAQGVTELAHQMGVAKSHAHRLLQTLVEQGYAQREDPGNYRASLRLWEIGQTALSNHELMRAASEPMNSLLDATHQSVQLAVLDQHDVVFVHLLEVPGHTEPAVIPGARLPADEVAIGRTMLAWLPSEQLAAFAHADGNGIRPLGAIESPQPLHADLGGVPEGLAESPEFLADMATIRRQGYAFYSKDGNPSIGGLAAPVRSANGTVVAAVGITAPVERLEAGDNLTLAPSVLQAAADIAHRLHLPVGLHN